MRPFQLLPFFLLCGPCLIAAQLVEIAQVSNIQLPAINAGAVNVFDGTVGGGVDWKVEVQMNPELESLLEAFGLAVVFSKSPTPVVTPSPPANAQLALTTETPLDETMRAFILRSTGPNPDARLGYVDDEEWEALGDNEQGQFSTFSVERTSGGDGDLRAKVTLRATGTNGEEPPEPVEIGGEMELDGNEFFESGPLYVYILGDASAGGGFQYSATLSAAPGGNDDPNDDGISSSENNGAGTLNPAVVAGVVAFVGGGIGVAVIAYRAQNEPQPTGAADAATIAPPNKEAKDRAARKATAKDEVKAHPKHKDKDGKDKDGKDKGRKDRSNSQANKTTNKRNSKAGGLALASARPKSDAKMDLSVLESSGALKSFAPDEDTVEGAIDSLLRDFETMQLIEYVDILIGYGEVEAALGLALKLEVRARTEPAAVYMKATEALAIALKENEEDGKAMDDIKEVRRKTMGGAAPSDLSHVSMTAVEEVRKKVKRRLYSRSMQATGPNKPRRASGSGRKRASSGAKGGRRKSSGAKKGGKNKPMPGTRGKGSPPRKGSPTRKDSPKRKNSPPRKKSPPKAGGGAKRSGIPTSPDLWSRSTVRSVIVDRVPLSNILNKPAGDPEGYKRLSGGGKRM